MTGTGAGLEDSGQCLRLREVREDYAGAMVASRGKKKSLFLTQPSAECMLVVTAWLHGRHCPKVWGPPWQPLGTIVHEADSWHLHSPPCLAHHPFSKPLMHCEWQVPRVQAGPLELSWCHLGWGGSMRPPDQNQANDSSNP